MIWGMGNTESAGTTWWGAIFLIFNRAIEETSTHKRVCTNESFLRSFLVPRISSSFFFFVFFFFSILFPAVPYKSAKILILIFIWEKNILSYSLSLTHTHTHTHSLSLSLSLSLAFSRERILPKRNDYHNAWRTLFFFQPTISLLSLNEFYDVNI